MAKTFAVVVALIAAFAAANGARAQVVSADPGKWAVELGVATRVRPHFIGSSEYKPDIVPIIEAAFGRRVHISLEDGATWSVVKWGQLQLGPVAEFRQFYDVKLPKRSRRAGDSTEVGLFSKIDLSIAEAEIRVRKAVSGYDGWSGDASFGTLVPLSKRISLGIEGRLGWGDQDFTKAHFGPSYETVRLKRMLRSEQFWTYGAQLGLFYQFTPKLALIGFVGDDYIVSPTKVKSFTSTRNAANFGVGCRYKVW